MPTREEDLATLARVGRMYLDALDADPEHELLSGTEALLVTEVREAVERWENPPAEPDPRHPPDLPDFRAGIYGHYKGPFYEAEGYAHDANYPGRVVVVYRGLQLDGAHLGPRRAVRTFRSGEGGFATGPYADHDAWADLVCTVHGQKMQDCERLPETHPGGLEAVQVEHYAVSDHIRPRFEYRGSQWLGQT